MRIYQTPTQNTTIYEQYPTINSGLDEQIVVGKSDDGLFRIRTLIQFDVTNISQSISNRTISPSCSFDLKLYAATASFLENATSLEIYPLSQSWRGGSNFAYQANFQVADGATWETAYSIFGINDTPWGSGSFISPWIVSGSSYISSSTYGSSNFPLPNPLVDITINITTLVQVWISGTLPNYGILLKFPDINESQSFNEGRVSLFSGNTHTIYSPQLITKWDDSIFITGSLMPPTTDLIAIPYDVSDKYRVNETPTIHLVAREKYPIKTFDNVFNRYDTSMFLPSYSFYSIIDDYSGTTIVPFDNYSFISTNPSGSFFSVPIQGMYPLRFYRVLIQTNVNGYTKIHDHNILFQVVP